MQLLQQHGMLHARDALRSSEARNGERDSDLGQRLDNRGLLSPHSTGDGAGDTDFAGQLVQPARQQKNS